MPVSRVPGAGMTEPVVREPFSESIPRKNDGTFAYGYPGGNKPTGPTLRKRFLEDPRTPLVFDRMLYRATDPEFGAWKPELAHDAGKFVIEQVIGKARQTIDVQDDTGLTILDILKQRAQQLGYIPQDSAPQLPAGEVDTPAPARKRGRPKGSTDKTPRKRRQA